MATRSPKPSAAISSSIIRFMGSVRGRERLRLLEDERRRSESERALARLRAQELELSRRGDVALAERRPARGIGRDGCAGGRRLAGAEHRGATTANVDVAARRRDDDDLG